MAMTREQLAELMDERIAEALSPINKTLKKLTSFLEPKEPAAGNGGGTPPADEKERLRTMLAELRAEEQASSPAPSRSFFDVFR